MFNRRVSKNDIKAVKGTVQIALAELSWTHEGPAWVVTKNRKLNYLYEFTLAMALRFLCDCFTYVPSLIYKR